MFPLFLLSALGLVVSFAIHLSSFIPGRIVEMGQVWPMHVLIFPLFLIMIHRTNKDSTSGKQGSFPPADAPRWMSLLITVLFIYALVNFAMLLVHTYNGGPRRRDGKYVQQNHGRVIKEITETEYNQLRAWEARGFSGHWMLFYSAPMAAFYAFWRRQKQPTP